jgi:hypothetical protein
VTSGYSGTPLAKKLGIKAGACVSARAAPRNYRALLAPLPAQVRFSERIDQHTDLLHLFATQRADLQRQLQSARAALRDDTPVWVSWPKKAAKVATDISEDVVRELALPLGFVDIKVCAVDETWSGLKLVVRLSERAAAPARRTRK